MGSGAPRLPYPFLLKASASSQGIRKADTQAGRICSPGVKVLCDTVKACPLSPAPNPGPPLPTPTILLPSGSGGGGGGGGGDEGGGRGGSFMAWALNVSLSHFELPEIMIQVLAKHSASC